jgi:hypothetical protein
MTLLIVLLLVLLGSVAVQLRSRAWRAGTAAVCMGLMAAVFTAMMLGYVSWGWDP